jgi:hypothetical protein
MVLGGANPFLLIRRRRRQSTTRLAPFVITVLLVFVFVLIGVLLGLLTRLLSPSPPLEAGFLRQGRT